MCAAEVGEGRVKEGPSMQIGRLDGAPHARWLLFVVAALPGRASAQVLLARPPGSRDRMAGFRSTRGRSPWYFASRSPRKWYTRTRVEHVSARVGYAASESMLLKETS
jgi:hypothetical protein